MKTTFKLKVIAVAVLANNGTLAQESEGESGELYRLEEVLVTAQRREQSLQDVPITISAFGANALEDAGIGNLDSLTAMTPGLSIGGGRSNTSVYLRGVGAVPSDPGDTSSVAIYVDGVYLASSLNGAFSFPNIDRIEVIKGPQGTLFGQSATGGLVHIITKDPTQEFTGAVKLSYGNYNTVGFNAYVSGGLTETLAADISIFSHDQKEGFGQNVLTGADAFDRREWQVRGKLFWQPADSTSVTLTGTYGENKNDYGLKRNLPGTPGIGAPSPEGIFDIDNDWQGTPKRTNYGASLRVKHDFGIFDFTSTTALNSLEVDQIFDQDTSPVDFVEVYLLEGSDSWQQEFLFNGGADAFTWTAGATYFYDESGVDPLTIIVRDANVSPPPFPRTERRASQDLDSKAIFGQVTFPVAEDLRLTLGARNTWDKRTFDFSEQLVDAACADPDLCSTAAVLMVTREGTDEESWDELTYRLALDFDLNDSTLLYGSYSRGYKTGGFNVVNIGPVGQAPSRVDPEILDAAELGFKWDSSNSKLRVNGAAFFYEYQDIQLVRSFVGGAEPYNAAEAEIAGLELESTWVASQTLTFTASFIYLHGEFTDFPAGSTFSPSVVPGPPLTESVEDLSGTSTLHSPEFTASISANYSKTTSLGTIGANILYSYNDGYALAVNEDIFQESFNKLNLRVGLDADAGWGVHAFMNNATDDEQLRVGDIGTIGAAGAYAPPRTYGIELNYEW